jgi:ATP-binding protein involved in chromosome partitioning
MPEITQEKVLEVLRTVKDPELHKDIVSLGMVKQLSVRGSDVSLEVTLTTPACPLKDRITEDIGLALRGNLPGVGKIDVRFGAEVRGSRPVGTEANRLPGVKNVIAVGSGKGGVGKSTIAVNLALALKQEGATAGLLDADIYGPSIPIMCGVKEGEKPTIGTGNRIIPLSRFGIPLMSMGFLMGPQDAVIWRGPMLAKMLQQFLEQVDWGKLDYLIVDLPPGTGDVQLSLSQLIPLSGAVVVTTPQDVALADVRRAVRMFQMTHVPILGIVENMSGFECPHCHQASPIFGGSPDKGRYKDLNIPFLGELPLEVETRVAGDQGEPIVARDPKSKQAERFRAVARQLAASQSVVNFQKELELPSLSQ